MRLLSTTDLIFREFYDSEVPPYAILSHRWIGNEVSLKEFYDIKAQDFADERFAKIRNFCAYARKDFWLWVWIDTCCIDNKSSAELSEAINSMFNWYQDASLCYVYLADVVWDPGNREQSRDSFRKSGWFDRGWTLQELLAPRRLCFVDRTWNFIGALRRDSEVVDSKSLDLIEDVSSRTGISKTDLLNAHHLIHLNNVSVARKFSWLSSRQTSRVEDKAYCMLGLCGVNMPLLYGEGKKAFTRLQLEIIRTSDDESIFAWFSDSNITGSGVLASSPEAFARSGQVVKHRPLPGKMPFAMTNKGLHYRVPIPKGSSYKGGFLDTYDLHLDCGLHFSDGGPDPSYPIAITLQCYGHTWSRIDCELIKEVDMSTWTGMMDREHEYRDLYLQAM